MEVKYTNLITELTKGKESLTAERNQLKTQFSNLTEEMRVLQDQYDSVVAGRDKLQEEVERLTSNRTGRFWFLN